MKYKYSIEDQINHFKSKGIKFSIMDEESAKDYLQNNTYFFKLKSYCKSFECNKKNQQYINVDFAYIVELSKLDMYLRSLIIKISLDTEHFLKVKLINDFTNNESENGYNIINLLFKNYPFIKNNIAVKAKDSACADLIYKYKDNWAIWNIVEVLSFGDFIKLFELYYQQYPDTKSSANIHYLLWSLKFIRNAAAHNNCLLNSLRTPYLHTHLLNQKNEIESTKALVSILSKIPNISKNTRTQKLKNPVIHDFIASLFLFDLVCTSKSFKTKEFKLIKDLFENRFNKHSNYFEKNNTFTSTYSFLIKIIDYLYQK